MSVLPRRPGHPGPELGCLVGAAPAPRVRPGARGAQKSSRQEGPGEVGWGSPALFRGPLWDLGDSWGASQGILFITLRGDRQGQRGAPAPSGGLRRNWLVLFPGIEAEPCPVPGWVTGIRDWNVTPGWVPAAGGADGARLPEESFCSTGSRICVDSVCGGGTPVGLVGRRRGRRGKDA